MSLKWFLHEVLKLPRERGLRSPSVSRGKVLNIVTERVIIGKLNSCQLRIMARSWFGVLFKHGFLDRLVCLLVGTIITPSLSFRSLKQKRTFFRSEASLCFA